MDTYVTSEEASAALKVSNRHIERMCRNGTLAGARKQGRLWTIPITADARLGRCVPAAERLDMDAWMQVPEPKRNDALRKRGLLKLFETFSAHHVSGGGYRSHAMAVFCSEKDLRQTSLKRWIKKYREGGILALADTRGGGSAAVISEEAWEYFKSLYLRPQQMSVTLCRTMLQHINATENKNWRVPSLRTLTRYARERIPQCARVLHREGRGAYDAQCAPYVQTDPASIEPGQIWVGDHHQFNCLIWHRGGWVRPWITAWEDMASRALVGEHVSIQPNQNTILLAMKKAIKEFGPPDGAKIDNGRDHDSQIFTGTTKAKRHARKKGYLDEQLILGVYAMLGISVSFALPYHAQSKPVERFFDTLDQQFCKTIPTYCGKDAKRKPEQLNAYLQSDAAKREAYDLKGFAALVREYIETVYNRSAHTGGGMDGRTPLEVMETRSSRRVILDSVLDLVARVWSEVLKVGKNGVRFKGMLYGQYDGKLLQAHGRNVRVTCDPHDLRRVHVYDGETL